MEKNEERKPVEQRYARYIAGAFLTIAGLQLLGVWHKVSGDDLVWFGVLDLIVALGFFFKARWLGF